MAVNRRITRNYSISNWHWKSGQKRYLCIYVFICQRNANNCGSLFFFLARMAVVRFIFIALIFIIVIIIIIIIIITICWLLCNWSKANFWIVSFWLYGEVCFRILLFLTVSQLGNMREIFLFSSLATTLPQKPIFLADDYNFVQNWLLLEWKWKIATKFIPVYRKVLSLHLQ